jgi:hypothetical protein
MSWVPHSWYGGKWLGPAVVIGGGGDCDWILPISARPIARSTVWSITTEELTVEATIKDTMKALNFAITERIGGQPSTDGEYFDEDN